MPPPNLKVLLLLAVAAKAKVIDGVVSLSSQTTEQYMGKFSFSPYQRSHIKGSFHVETGQYFDHHPHALVLCLYNERQWRLFQEAMNKGSLCVDRKNLASWTTERINPSLRQEVDPKTGRSVPKRDFAFSSHLKAPSHQAHYWFAVLMDCYLEEYDAHPPPMQYHMTFTNGESHLPADETGMITINLVTLVLMGAYGAYFFVAAYTRMRRVGQVHLITLIFFVAYALQTLSVGCELLHLRRFAADGKGLRWRHTIFAMDFVSGLAQSVSELVLSVMLIALAFGWTLGLESQEPIEGLAGKLLAGLHRPATLLRGFSSPSSLLLLSIGGSQLVLHFIGRKYEEDFNNFHDFEHWPGVLLLVIRLGLCALFLWALRRSQRVERQREVLGFLSKLMAFGSVWFLCLPVLVVLALAAAPYHRHQLVAGGSICLQAISLALLSTLFLEGSEYYRISSLSHVGSVFNHGASPFHKGAKLAVD
jgi:hypothetical protein